MMWRPVLSVGLSILVFLCAWQVLVWATGLKPFLLPGPLRVAGALWSNLDSIGWHALVTSTEILAGLVFGLGLGVVTAIQLAMSPAARIHVRPVLVLLQAVPFFALAPILTFWMGYGMAPKIVMAMLIIYFPVTSSFFDGLMRTPPGYLDLARTMGAPAWTVLWRVRIPSAVPALASGLKLGAVFTPIGAVIGEWVGGSGAGLGYLMLLANGRAKIDLMFACVVILAVITVLLYWIADRLGEWMTRRFS
ncbi:MAG: ABC transporter permease [Pseudomonadota bacterium]